MYQVCTCTRNICEHSDGNAMDAYNGAVVMSPSVEVIERTHQIMLRYPY